MKALTDFNFILNTYDYFLIDLWGTIHDGKRLYPGIQQRLRHLKNLKKHIIFISNTPRPNAPIHEMLASLGLTTQEYDLLVTSGDTFLEAVQNSPELKKPFYFMGEPLHASLLERLHEPAKDLSKASYVLCSSALPNYETILKEALKQNKPLVCVNPDLIVMIDGECVICAGSVARDYSNQGGIVKYYGKPYSTIYDYTFQNMGNPSKKKVLMIGDGLYTDILGANNYGIDSLLVNTGVHQVVDIADSIHALEKLSNDLGIKPTYFLKAFGEK